MSESFKAIYNAGGKWDKMIPFPEFTIPYTKGRKLEMMGTGIFSGSLSLNMDAELIGVSIVDSDGKFTGDYVEVFIDDLQIVETCYLNNMNSSVFSEINFKKAYKLASGTPIRYAYNMVDETDDYRAVFFNFHFLLGSDKEIPDVIGGDNGYHKYPTPDDLNKDGFWYNLIGTDENGGKSVDKNHKRFNSQKNFVVEEINGKKMVNTITPNGTRTIPVISRPLKVLEIYPYDVSTHPQQMTVLQYMTSIYGIIEGQQLFDITTKTYAEANAMDITPFDAVFFSPSDCNAYKDVTPEFADKLKTFIENGKAVVSSHDTLWETAKVFDTLSSYFGIQLDNNDITYWSGFEPMVDVINRSQLTDYPYKLPDKFHVLGYHRTGRTVKLGDNWVIDEAGISNMANFTKNYVWLTSQDNCVFLEAGHLYYLCNGQFNQNPLEWESKAIINALYCAQEPEYRALESVSEYIVNIPTQNINGGYVETDMTCYTKVTENGQTVLKPGASKVEIWNDNKLLEVVRFPQNNLDPKFYNEGWSTIEYKGRLSVFPNSKTLKIKYFHTSSNPNAFLNLGDWNIKLY